MFRQVNHLGREYLGMVCLVRKSRCSWSWFVDEICSSCGCNRNGSLPSAAYSRFIQQTGNGNYIIIQIQKYFEFEQKQAFAHLLSSMSPESFPAEQLRQIVRKMDGQLLKWDKDQIHAWSKRKLGVLTRSCCSESSTQCGHISVWLRIQEHWPQANSGQKPPPSNPFMDST